MRKRGARGTLAGVPTRTQGALLAAALLSAACGETKRTAEVAPSGDRREPPASDSAERSRVVAPDRAEVPREQAEAKVPWFRGSFDEALAAARAQGKLVFVEVGAFWCPPCQRLDEETFSDPKVVALLSERFVPLHLDVERSDDAQVAERYHVMAYPTMLVLETGGLEKGRIVDFVPPDAFVEQVSAIAAGGNVLGRLDAEAAAKPDDLELAYRVAHAHMLAADRAGAEARYAAIELADPKGELGLLPKVAFDRAAMIEKLDGDCERAVGAYRDVARRFPDHPIALSARRRVARCLLRLGKPEAARAEIEALLREGEEDPRVLSNVAWFCFRNRAFLDLGRSAAEKGGAIASDDPDFPYLAAELAFLSGDRAAALRHMDRAIAAAGGRTFYRTRRAEMAAQGPGRPALP